MKRRKLYTVITSKEHTPYVMGWEKYKDVADIEIKTDNIIWRFDTPEEASMAANLFMNLGFEYVRRPLVKE